MPTWNDLYNHEYDIEADYNSDEFFDGPVYPDKINKKTRGVVDGQFIAPLKENKDDVPLESTNKKNKEDSPMSLTENLKASGKSDNKINIKRNAGKAVNRIGITGKSSKRNNEI